MSKKFIGEESGFFTGEESGLFQNEPRRTTSVGVRCHVTHPLVTLAKGTFCGGSCYHPRPGFDVYVGLDSSMEPNNRSYPWEENRVESLHFQIPDMGTPSDSKLFKKLVTWLCNRLQDGKNVHVGCIGGHGRTGMVLSAIVGELGEKDAIQWAREHYCKKAVESAAQVDFLMRNFGVSTVKGFKEGPHSSTSKSSKNYAKTSFEDLPLLSAQVSTRAIDGAKTYAPAKSKKSIWRE